MESVSGHALEELRVDGGATANGWLMQFQADMLGTPVAVAEMAETTALGAALLAGVGVGAWTQDDVARRDGEGARYEPRMGDDERYALVDDWRRAVQRARGWAQG
jgi:glycerol kinase